MWTEWRKPRGSASSLPPSSVVTSERSATMREWGYPVPPEELVAVSEAADAFRKLWASIRPPWPHAFDGTVNDVRAIDYLDYEGINFPKCGIEGAALVCGEVLRRAAGLEWVTSY